jgi:peroxiredoxin
MLGQGESAPDFELEDAAGHAWSLREALKASPVVLVFFKISCPTCQLALPFLERLLKGTAPGAPQLVAISQDDAVGTGQFQRRFQLTMRTILDRPGAYPASNAYGIRNVPSLFVVEQDGRISSSVAAFSKVFLEQLGERFGIQPFRCGEQVPELRPG